MVESILPKRPISDSIAEQLATHTATEVYHKRSRTSNKQSAITVHMNHPLGIRPLGNLILCDNDAYVSSSQIRAKLLGYFAILPDELISLFLQTLGATELRRLGYSSRIFSAFAAQDDLWKQLFVIRAKSPHRWHGTWRRTYLEIDEENEATFQCHGFYSDTLYRPFFCASFNLTEYLQNLRTTGSESRTIPRLSQCPSKNEFDTHWAFRPFILEQHEWPTWTIKDLEREYGSLRFIQECVQWQLAVYSQYMQHNTDESPLYLFDREFADKTKLAAEYKVPDIFAADYFKVLESIRPDYQWLIIGPERSGSTFHKDPNATSAWNAVIEGEKYWIMFPPDVLPPGVFTSHDESEVTSPLSIAEWILGFHKAAMSTPGYVDGFCGAGEVLYVPSGWWHLVVNLRNTAAITQNFVPLPHVMSVLKFFHHKKDQISGFRQSQLSDDDDENEAPAMDVLSIFIQRLKDSKTLPESTIQKIDKWSNSLGESKWTKLTDEKEDSFSFGFGEGSSDEES
ncbi:hypothetical protein V1508DRAFT_350982 [Lipomyces doorenjongii]|uniref:uncharacterized protein n=1 Tax=Lipomyces doorenjongii TaxID=383834 RepID=UPI0034CF10A7